MRKWLAGSAVGLLIVAGISTLLFVKMGGGYYAKFNRQTSFSNRKVTLYSGGQAVRTFTSRGAVLSEENSDGYYFTDNETGKLIELEGDIVIEEE